MTTKNINTLEELTNYALDNPYSSSRWKLEDTYNRIWVDEDAGEKWSKELGEFHETYGHYNLTPEDAKIEDEIFSRQPEKRHYKTYRLQQHTTGRWSSGATIHLSKDLGEMIDTIWKKKTPSWTDNTDYVERTSVITLQTILRRLGKTDIGKQIATIKKNRADAEQQQRKENSKASVIAKTDELLKSLNTAVELEAITPAVAAVLVNKLESFKIDLEVK
jgi:hypothetical protein